MKENTIPATLQGEMQMLTCKQVATLLCCGRNQVTMFEEEGLLHPTFYGKAKVYHPGAVRNFQAKTNGLNINSRTAIKKYIQDGVLDLADFSPICPQYGAESPIR